MARHRAGAVVYAQQDTRKLQTDFWTELDHRCLDRGLPPGATAISQFTGVQAQTIRAYRRGENRMQVSTLQALVKALAPDIRVVLRLLGYSDAQIRNFAKEVTK